VIYIGCKNQTKNKKKWLTPTLINAYLDCPRKYYLKKFVKHSYKPSIHLIRGNAVHKTIELFYKLKINRCINFDLVDFKKILQDLFSLEWEEQKTYFEWLDLTNTEIEFFYHDSLKMLDNFARNFYFSQGMEKPSPAIEKNLVSNNLMLKGRVDAIHFDLNARGPPLIVDYKTSKSKELTKDNKRQLLIYALLYFENHGIIPDIAVHFLNFKDGMVHIPAGVSDLIEIKNLVRDVHGKTQSKNISDYPCTCGWCKNEFCL